MSGHEPGGRGGGGDLALRVEALEALLVEKGFLDPTHVDALVRRYEEEVGPLNGARVVARAWVDPGYRGRLLADGTAAIAELGFGGPQGEHVVVVENTASVHNVVVCTLCSCYPWPVLGLPPAWYKSPAYRSRVVREPRAVLREMGLDLPPEVEVRVWDSSSEVRYLVLPERPPGTDGLSEAALRELVTRNVMIGVAKPRARRRGRPWLTPGPRAARAAPGGRTPSSTSTAPRRLPAGTASSSSRRRGRAASSA